LISPSPSSQTFVIKNTNVTGITQNFVGAFNFSIPVGISNGQWRLEVNDNSKLDTGFIDYWKITLP